MPVPQGFTITTEACTQYYKDDHQINAEIEAEIMEYVEKLEEMTGKKFGDLYLSLIHIWPRRRRWGCRRR